MENCIVSKLKVIFDNDNLLKYGTFRIKRVSSESYDANNARLTLLAAADFTVTTKGNGFMADSAANLSDPETCYTEKFILADTQRTIFFSNGNYDIEISAKYSLKNIGTGDSSYDALFELDLDDFEFDSDIVKIDFQNNNVKVVGDLSVLSGKSVESLGISSRLATNNQNSNITGDINNLSNATAIRVPGQSGVYGNINSLNSSIIELFVCGTNCEGTASQLGRYTSVARLFIAQSHITGSIEDFVASQVQNGRETADLIWCYGILSKLSFGGIIQEPSGYTLPHRLVFDGTRSPHKITVQGSGSGKKWYISGWTQAEIDDYTQQGYTLINCDQN